MCACVCASVRACRCVCARPCMCACVCKYAIILVNLILLAHATKMKILFTTVVSPGDESQG